MSASVATHMAGLLTYDFSPDNMPDFSSSAFPDHMELDRSADADENLHHDSDESPTSQRRHHAPVTQDTTNSKDQNEALGNLLGALMQNNNEQSGGRSNFAAEEDGFFTAQGQPDTSQQPVVDQQAQPDNSRLPSFDATAANDMFLAEDFPDLDQNMIIPRTPNGHVMNFPINGHLRQDSFASQGSVARRPPTPQQREFEAFARLQFEDGSYYLNTYACELGRDVLAYRAALQKEREEKEAEMNGHGKSRSSSGRASHRSGPMRRQMGSQVQGSVVSEQGGFAGIDEAPMRPPQNPEKSTMSSQESESSVVKPAEYLINPRTMPSFDYHRSTEMQAKWVAQEENEGVPPDDEQPAAVTAAHLPNPHMCPLIPIHGRPKDGLTDAECHKKISRRHIKIQWSFEHDCWQMKVQGRNGVYCDKKFVHWKGVVPLQDGSVIQIAHIVLTFHLPKTAQQQELEAKQAQVDLGADEALPSVESRQSESVMSDERRESISDIKSIPKISLKLTQRTEPSSSELPIGPDGMPIVKRRGPGRPPKDGIMSTRERKEREKAAKLAAAREANGGKTPPPAMRAKLPKAPSPVVEEIKIEIKPEKRKYTRRKTIDENGDPLPDIDGDVDEAEAASDGEPKSKKARTQREKSESPEYPPRESLTAEQLARPPESYAQLLFKILTELYPRALPLKDIYRELKKRYPWYVYEAQTEGWQSSVRHNLNSEYNKLFDKGDKEGKGFAWRAIPDAQLPQSEKKRTTQPPAQRPRPNSTTQRPSFQPLPGQNAQWQGTGTFPLNGGQQPFINHGPWPPQGQANSNWQQSGTPPNGAPQQSPVPGVPQQAPFAQSTQPGPVHPRAPGQSSQAPSGNAPPPAPHPAPAPSASSSSAASNMPCLMGGIDAIKRFEEEMYKQLGVDEASLEKREFWHAVFASAKKRVLHGYPTSTTGRGESKEESTIIAHMQCFIDRFRNPNFKGFTPRVAPSNAAEQGSAHQATPQVQTPAPTVSPAAPSASLAVVSQVPLAPSERRVSTATESTGALAANNTTPAAYVKNESPDAQQNQSLQQASNKEPAVNLSQ